jgi:hypothetical protein
MASYSFRPPAICSRSWSSAATSAASDRWRPAENDQGQSRRRATGAELLEQRDHIGAQEPSPDRRRHLMSTILFPTDPRD